MASVRVLIAEPLNSTVSVEPENAMPGWSLLAKTVANVIVAPSCVSTPLSTL